MVVIAGVGLGVGFFITQIGGSSAPPLPSTTKLPPQAAASIWQPLVHGGQPPTDVLGNLVVPTGVVVTGYRNLDQGVGQYDREAELFVPASLDQVLGFYGAELPALGWKIRAVAYTSDHRGRQVLAYRFSQDSYQWQAKLVIDTGTHSGQPGTALTVEAFQLSEDEG